MCPKGRLEVAMKLLNKAVSLWVVSCGMVQLGSNSCTIDAQTCGSPLSDDISRGTPNRAIQCVTNACAQVAVVVLESGMASGQRVKRSITVSR